MAQTMPDSVFVIYLHVAHLNRQEIFQSRLPDMPFKDFRYLCGMVVTAESHTLLYTEHLPSLLKNRTSDNYNEGSEPDRTAFVRSPAALCHQDLF